jgi:SAM-dependent methyltransferase
MARVRLDRDRLVRTMRQRWASADAPPWGTLTGDPVEQEKAALLAAYLDGVRSVLDCGCGGGDFLALLDPERRFTHVVGVDVAEQAIARARRTGRYAALVCGHVEDLAFDQDSEVRRFDLLLFGEMLYYNRDYRLTLSRTLERFLAPHGLVFVSLAMGRSYFHRRDADVVRTLMRAGGLRAVADRRIEYRTWGGVPRRWCPFVFSQDSKQLLIYRLEL